MRMFGKHGVQLLPDIVELFILLFADDLALLACSPSGLQRQLNCLHEMCNQLGVTINIDKSKIMVFRKGGFLSKHEQWSINDEKIDVVNSYVYLGFTFTTSMNISHSVKQFAMKGKRSLFEVIKTHYALNQMTRKTFFKIFDTMIQPILSYTAEIWSLLVKEDPTEKIHLFACKKFLNVALQIIYGELGRHPLIINDFVKTIKLWFRMLGMDEKRLPKQAYKMLLNLDSVGKHNWVSELKFLLNRTGFGFVWLAQGVGNVNQFCKEFKQRLIDMNMQDWESKINSSERYSLYRYLKSDLGPEMYLDCFKQKCFRDALIRFRMGISNLKIHKK